MTADTTAMLALLQFSDSGFPSGGFAHSYGLEQLLNEDLLDGAAGVEAFVASVLAGSVATADARAAYGACVAAAAGDIGRVVGADRAIYRTKAASELREACVVTGRRLTEEAAVHLEAPLLVAYRRNLRAEMTPGCHAAVFGLVTGLCGVAALDAAAALLLSSANGLLQAAMRLGRISHRDTQGILHRLRDPIAGLVEEIASDGTRAELRAFHPLQEIASMRHARAQARLFAS